MNAAKQPRRPGRPAAELDTQPDKREKIFDVAEEVFAERGYAPTSLRQIAQRASVNPALIAYYFGSKERLFEEVFKRRGKLIEQRWEELLDELEARPADGRGVASRLPDRGIRNENQWTGGPALRQVAGPRAR